MILRTQTIFQLRKFGLMPNINRHVSSLPSIGVIGVPYWNGQRKPGVELAPDALRGYGLLHKLNVINPNVVDFGNLNFDILPNDQTGLIDSSTTVHNKNEFIFARMCTRLSQMVQDVTEKGFVPLILGGDHSMAVGSVFGSFNAKREPDVDMSVVSIY